MSKSEGYIDIHAHILPGVDDGSGSMEETIKMLKTAFGQNIRTIIATPHFVAGRKNTPVDQLIKVKDRVQEEAKKLSEEFTILLGNELYYSDSIVDSLKAKEALTLAGSRYVLVEFSVSEAYKSIYKAFGELIRAGYIPILAHVERYHCLTKREDLISELIELGCYIQMNASSLIGGIFNSEANLNRKIFNSGFVHFVGSDCHDEKDRIPVMDNTVKTLQKRCDERLIAKVFNENPGKVLKNTYI